MKKSIVLIIILIIIGILFVGYFLNKKWDQRGIILAEQAAETMMAQKNLCLSYQASKYESDLFGKAERCEQSALLRMKQGMYYQAQEKYGECTELYKTVVQLIQNRIAELIKQGDDALAHHKTFQAINFFISVLELDPKNPVALEGKGKCYLEEEDIEQAYELIRQAFQLSNKPIPIAILPHSYSIVDYKLFDDPEKYIIVIKKDEENGRYGIFYEHFFYGFYDDREDDRLANNFHDIILQSQSTVVYAAKRGGKHFIVKNGQEQKQYDGLWSLHHVDTDEEIITYIAREREKELLVKNDQEGKKYDGIGDLQLSSDGQTIAYIVQENEKLFVVKNGQEGKRYDEIEFLQISPDGHSLVYAAREGEKLLIVINEKEGKKYDDQNLKCQVGVTGKKFCTIEKSGTAKINLNVSIDGHTVAYIVHEGQEWFVVKNDIEGQRRKNWISGLQLSPDGKNIAYVVHEDKKEFVVMNEEEGKRYDSIRSRLAFSSDGRTIVYIAQKDEKEFIVKNGQEGKPYDGVGSPSSDGNMVVYEAREGNKCFVVKNDEEGKRYDCDSMSPIIFAPKGQTIAYVIEKEKCFVVKDREEGKQYDEVQDIQFSPDGRVLAYRAKLSGKWLIVTNDKESKRYERVSLPYFSKDSKEIAYFYMEGQYRFLHREKL